MAPSPRYKARIQRGYTRGHSCLQCCLEVRPVCTDTVVIVDERDTSGGQPTIFNHVELQCHADFLDCHKNVILCVSLSKYKLVYYILYSNQYSALTSCWWNTECSTLAHLVCLLHNLIFNNMAIHACCVQCDKPLGRLPEEMAGFEVPNTGIRCLHSLHRNSKSTLAMETQDPFLWWTFVSGVYKSLAYSWRTSSV